MIYLIRSDAVPPIAAIVSPNPSGSWGLPSKEFTMQQRNQNKGARYIFDFMILLLMHKILLTDRIVSYSANFKSFCVPSNTFYVDRSKKEVWMTNQHYRLYTILMCNTLVAMFAHEWVLTHIIFKPVLVTAWLNWI